MAYRRNNAATVNLDPPSLDEALAELQGHLDRPEVQEQDGLVYELTQRHHYHWGRFVTDAAADKAIMQWVDHDPAWPKFGTELFSRLFTADDLDELDTPVDWAQRAHDLAGELPEFEALMAVCRGRRWDSGMATLAMSKAVIDLWAKQPEQEQPQPPQDGDQEQGGNGSPKGQNGQQGAAGEQPGAGSPAPGGQPQGDDQGGGAGAQGQAPQGATGAPQAGDGPSGCQQSCQLPGGQQEPDERALRQAVRAASKQALADHHEAEAAIDALTWGTSGSGDRRMPPQQRTELAKLLAQNPGLRKLALEVGRLIRLAASKRKTEVDYAPDQIANITLGNELERLLPAELVQLTDPDFEMESVKRLIEHSAMVYELKGRDTAERGPVVVLLDQSWSMNGRRMHWGTVLSLALANEAVRDGREALVIPFDTELGDAIHFDRQTLVRSTIELASVGADGGTNWDKPLQAALDVITDRSEHRSFNKADVVLVTDGECRLSESVRRGLEMQTERLGVEVYGVNVGSASANKRLGSFCTQLYHVNTAKPQGEDVEILCKVKQQGKE